uniref:Uncharacterized protein n=1 Tax=Rhizophagus irregularis (strain DAOM 181602 / DAOM 197198 / MUCL 43194) TaxID=747089 RepID=U9UJI8_RHIID
MIKRLKSSISEKAIIPAVEDYDFPAFFFNFTLRAQNYIKNNYLYPPLYLSITLVQNYWTIQLLHQRVLQLHHSTIFLLQVFMFLRYVINLYLTGQYTLTKKGTFTLGSPQWFQHLRDKTKDHVKKILTKKERKERKAFVKPDKREKLEEIVTNRKSLRRLWTIIDGMIGILNRIHRTKHAN